MTSREPAIIFPAPGLPLFVEEGRPHVALTVAGNRAGLDGLRQWARRLSLRGVGGETIVPMDIESVHLLEGPPDPMIRGFVELSDAEAPLLVHVGLRPRGILRPTAPSTVQLYDLVAGDRLARSRSVAVLLERVDALTLAFASDLHMAGFWEVIWETVQRRAPDLAPRVLRPASLLDRFIQQANALWSRGELDLIVLGGDLVEYICKGTDEGHCGQSAPTNVQAFAQALLPLKVPTIAIPGNHDYRAHPWRGRTYGLAGVRIPASRTREVLEAAGLWDRWALRPADLAALRTVDREGRPAISHFTRSISPARDFALTVGGLRLVFASTGCDVLARWRHVEWARWGLLLRSIGSAWHHPESEGLTEEQVQSIASSLSSARGAAVFFHAPLFHTADPAALKRHALRLSFGPQEKLAQRAAFERWLRAAGIRSGVFFRNPGPLIQALVSASGPVATFSGHVHRATALELDRRTLYLRSVDRPALESPVDTVTLLTAPALGLQGCRGNAQPGYLLARFEQGALVRLGDRCTGFMASDLVGHQQRGAPMEDLVAGLCGAAGVPRRLPNAGTRSPRDTRTGRSGRRAR